MSAFRSISEAIQPMVGWIAENQAAKTALLVAFLTPVVRFFWLLTSGLYRSFFEWWGRRVEKCEIRLGPVLVPHARLPLWPRRVTIHCLIIRYGSDAYLEKLASEQDRVEGRIRYEVSKSTLQLVPGNWSYVGIMKLKVHKRLGTQFKLFFEVETDTEARRYRSLLRRLPDLVTDVSVSHYGARPKIWFLLRRYHIAESGNETVRREGRPVIRNNFYFPV